MGQKHSGNYSAKHISGVTIAKPIENAVRSRIENGKIRCADAHIIAKFLSVSPQQVGVAIDLCEARIISCQLGLFNNSDTDEAGQQSNHVTSDLQLTIQAETTDGCLSCIRAWQIADANHLPRILVGKTCDIEGIKISECQLGAF